MVEEDQKMLVRGWHVHNEMFRGKEWLSASQNSRTGELEVD